jgi:hypothetical protein
LGIGPTHETWKATSEDNRSIQSCHNFCCFFQFWSDFSYISIFCYFQTISPTYKLAHILLRSKCINNTSFLYGLHISGNIGTPMLLTCRLVSYIIDQKLECLKISEKYITMFKYMIKYYVYTYVKISRIFLRL